MFAAWTIPALFIPGPRRPRDRPPKEGRPAEMVKADMELSSDVRAITSEDSSSAAWTMEGVEREPCSRHYEPDSEPTERGVHSSPSAWLYTRNS